MVGETVPIQKDDRINLETNWKQFCDLLLETKREGVEQLISTLDKTDFKDAPASHKYHLSVKGGLCQHSLNTNKFAHELNGMLGLDLPVDSLTIASLLHDLCKINYYIIKEEWDKEYKDKMNIWRKKEVYGIDDKFPLGHGEKSIAIALTYGIKLKAEEVLAIRWHMAFSDFGVHGGSGGMTFRKAFDEYSIVKIVAMADQSAVIHEDHIWTPKEQAK